MADGSGLAVRIVKAPSAPVEAPREFRYIAFLSYGHRDGAFAKWLHDSLENYRVPRSLVGRVTANGPIPPRLNPIFRDRHELAASEDLAGTIRDALARSRFLIVLCSPSAAASRWTDAEIDGFKKLRPDGCVVAAILAGEPFANEMPGREAEECFPLALRHKYDRRGRPTKQRAEPIAADFREGGDGRRLGLLKIVAGMLGVGLDDLVHRESRRRQQRQRAVLAASVAGMMVTSTLAAVAFEARNEAREQRQEAEGLIGFMLGDLRGKLEPIGRLDALDAVGAKVLSYYQRQDKRELGDESLAKRARALTLIGEMASLRGDLDGALRRYGEALASTGEALRRDPTNPQRLFDHAQNLFWVGSIDWQRGRAEPATRYFREYRALADRMIVAAPGDPKYLLEGIYADTNLGMVQLDARSFDAAIATFTRLLAASEALVMTDASAENKKMLLEALAYLSEAEQKSGRLDRAIALRSREIALLAPELAAAYPDAEYRTKAIAAQRSLGMLLASRGATAAGIRELRTGADIAHSLVALEPANTDWQERSANIRFDLARILLSAGQTHAATQVVRSGCETASRLATKNDSVVAWSFGLRRTCAMSRARIALAARDSREALIQARLAAAPPGRGQLTEDNRVWLGQARQLLGDAEAAAGKPAAAQLAWRSALATLPQGNPESQNVLASRALLQQHLGNAAAAGAIAGDLRRIGFRSVEFETAYTRGEGI